MQNHYFDEHGYYTHSLEANPNSRPPKNAVRVAPPNLQQHECAQWDNEQWNVKPDYKGENYWLHDGTEGKITERGVGLPEGAILEAPPDEWHTTHDGESWQLDLAAKREWIRLKIQGKKKEMRNAGFLVNDTLFDSDNAARIAYTELNVKLQADPTFTVSSWKASKGVWVTMDAALFADVMAAGEAHLQSCFEWQQQEELRLNACTTKEELEAFDVAYTE